jgi:hypothetical protein
VASVMRRSRFSEEEGVAPDGGSVRGPVVRRRGGARAEAMAEGGTTAEGVAAVEGENLAA